MAELSELIQRSQGLKDEAARLLTASRELDERIKAALSSTAKDHAKPSPPSAQ